MNPIGKGIREYRKKLHMTQEELAEGICNRSYISQIEKGQVIPSPEILEQLAKRLQIDLRDLWTESEKPDFTRVEIENTVRHLVNRIDSNDWEIARKWLIKLENADLSESEKAIFLWGKGIFSEHDSRFDKAEVYFLESIELSRQLDDPVPLIRSLNSLGALYCKTRQSKKAIPHVNEAYRLIIRHAISGLMRISLMHTSGMMHGTLGEYNSAIEQLKQAEQLNQSYRTMYKSDEIYMVRAICHSKLKEYEEAESYYLQALEILKINPHPRVQANVYSNLGTLYSDLKKYDAALEKLNQAISIYKELGNVHGQNNSTLEIANIYKQLGRLDEARTMCEAVLENSTTDHIRAEARLVLADIHCEQKQPVEALNLLEAALDHFSTAETHDFLVKAYRLLAKINLQYGRLEEAARLYSKYLS
ncbi:tetratricopeptide repeat protein [Brevibacillus dissolubilis]|uniref:tetratricopeptide repeat protein n=1 Tax=Brevibacillus dissolubilis TaxID=1844116 RepID=UPI0021003AD8|nr:tetratricopeptide repeat protein [Brevibacillus dissolubilis]